MHQRWGALGKVLKNQQDYGYTTWGNANLSKLKVHRFRGEQPLLYVSMSILWGPFTVGLGMLMPILDPRCLADLQLSHLGGLMSDLCWKFL